MGDQAHNNRPDGFLNWRLDQPDWRSRTPWWTAWPFVFAVVEDLEIEKGGDQLKRRWDPGHGGGRRCQLPHQTFVVWAEWIRCFAWRSRLSDVCWTSCQEDPRNRSNRFQRWLWCSDVARRDRIWAWPTFVQPSKPFSWNSHWHLQERMWSGLLVIGFWVMLLRNAALSAERVWSSFFSKVCGCWNTALISQCRPERPEHVGWTQFQEFELLRGRMAEDNL